MQSANFMECRHHFLAHAKHHMQWQVVEICRFETSPAKRPAPPFIPSTRPAFYHHIAPMTHQIAPMTLTVDVPRSVADETGDGAGDRGGPGRDLRRGGTLGSLRSAHGNLELPNGPIARHKRGRRRFPGRTLLLSRHLLAEIFTIIR